MHTYKLVYMSRGAPWSGGSARARRSDGPGLSPAYSLIFLNRREEMIAEIYFSEEKRSSRKRSEKGRR